jgi:Nif-specific regulatory protein
MERAELELTILDEISRVLGSTLDLRRIFDEIMNILAARLEMRRGTLVLMDDSARRLNIEAAHGLTDEEKRRGTYKVGEGITGMAVEQGTPIVVPDIRKDPRFLNRTGARARDRHDIISFICIPIRIESRVVGALSVDKPFTDESTLEKDRRLITIIASIVSQALKINQMVRLETETLKEQNVQLRRELKGQYQFHNIVGVSGAMKEVFDATARVARSKASVLLRGETGTGKELIARAIHYNSDRADKPFVRVNCGALTESLLETELFGHVKGAFTGAIHEKKGLFEVADKGTLFLDEVSEMSPSLQVKFLRVLEEKELKRVGGTETIRVDCRIIAATNRDLEELIKQDRFREDLYYRLNVVPIYLPPLRERREDIPLLVSHLLDKHNKENQKHVTQIEPGAMALLLQYPWPGNVRELDNYIARAIVLSAGDTLTTEMLPANVRSYHEFSGHNAPPGNSILDQLFGSHGAIISSDATGLIARMEKALIERVLKLTNNVQTEAARILGVNRNTLRNKIKGYRIRERE